MQQRVIITLYLPNFYFRQRPKKPKSIDMNLLKWLVFATISFLIPAIYLHKNQKLHKVVGKWHIKDILYLSETQVRCYRRL